MPTRTQKTIALFNDTARSLSDVNNWTSFLKTAAWQYKYPFDDQLLIYVQRPDATACATLEVWNKNMHRWINKGSKGIALLREDGSRFGLEFVFDVSDTHDRYNRGVRLWQYEQRFDNAIIESLSNSFGELKPNISIYEAIRTTVHNAVEDNKADYLHELKYARQGSFLTGLDDVNLDVRFRQTAEASVAFMIMERMGLEPEHTLDYYEFEHIRDFNTRDTIAILGSAVSAISEAALREISRTISAERKSERKKFAQYRNQSYNRTENINSERNEDNGRVSIQDSGRLSDTRSDSTGNGSTSLEVRNDEEDVSPQSSQESVHEIDDVGRAAQSLGGSGQSSDRAGADDSQSDGAGRGSDGGTQSAGLDEMDASDEQFSPFSGRSIM